MFPAIDVVPKRASDSAPANPASAPHERVHLDQVTVDVDARAPDALLVGADRVRVPAEAGLGQDDPEDSATTAAITTSHGICPNRRPVPMVSTSLNGTSRSSTPPVISSAAPRAMPRVPSVTMNDGILALVTRKPLRIPQRDAGQQADDHADDDDAPVVSADGVHRPRRDDAGEHEHRSDRQVDARGDDHVGQAGGDDQQHRRVSGDVAEVRHREELVELQQREDDDQRRRAPGRSTWSSR